MEKRSLRETLKKQNINPDQLTPEQARQFGQVKQVYDQYKDKSAEEISGEIDALKNQQEVRNFIKSGKMDEIARNFKPFLGGNASKLDDIMRQLKR